MSHFFSRFFLLCFFFFLGLGSSAAIAAQKPAAQEAMWQGFAENYAFSGLASYFNHVRFFVVDREGAMPVVPETGFPITKTLETDQQWLVAVSRFNVMAVNNIEGVEVVIDQDRFYLSPPDGKMPLQYLIPKSALHAIDPSLDQLRYVHLWWPLAELAKLVEASLVWIQKSIVSHWGLAIIIFSIVLKVLLLPVSAMTVRFQRHVSACQAALLPVIEEIKKHYDGEEAHNRIMAAHKELGVSPFYTLKPMLGVMIQLPILIAIFNALGEMPQLQGESFLWVDDLAYPDSVLVLPFSIPFLGNELSALPWVMMIVTMISTMLFRNSLVPAREQARQKRNLFLMALVFFLLFYPFPAAMVLYWAMANLLQGIQQQFLRV